MNIKFASHRFKVRLSSDKSECYVEMDGERLKGVRAVKAEMTAEDFKPLVIVTFATDDLDLEADT